MYHDIVCVQVIVCPVVYCWCGVCVHVPVCERGVLVSVCVCPLAEEVDVRILVL